MVCNTIYVVILVSRSEEHTSELQSPYSISYAVFHRILHLHVRLDSLLLVMQLNGVYRVRNLVLFRRYLRVELLICEFETITVNHVPREQNHYVDSIANHVLDWYLSHAFHTRQ